MRYKIEISAPAILSIAVFIFGLLAMLLYSLDVINGRSGSGFVISIDLQTLIIYLLSLLLCSILIFRFLKRKDRLQKKL